MECKHCQSQHIRKNGLSRHGHQRYLCYKCRRTFGEVDHRAIPEEKKAEALKYYLEGLGLRAIERLLGVSHNSVMNWVLQAVEGKSLEKTESSEVQWVEADELWSYIGKKKNPYGSGGLLIVLPKKYVDGRWGDRSTETARQLDSQLPHGQNITYCTDFWHPYGIIFEEQNHLQGKAHTFTIESYNNRIRVYLARLRRKTHCYSKSLKNLSASIALLFIV
jgi:insertion element IS1 protein InsB